MKRNLLIGLSASISIVFLTYIAIEELTILLILAGLCIFLIAFTLIGDWWRRSYVFLIFSLAAGASHIAPVAALGTYFKALALGFVVVVTILTSNNGHKRWANKLHKSIIYTLGGILLLATLSTVWSAARFETLTQTLFLGAFFYVIYSLSAGRWQNKSLIPGDIGALYWAVFVVLAVGLGLALVGFPEAISTYSGRYQGLLNNPNLLGMVSAIALTLGISWASHRHSMLGWISLIIPASQVLLSESRTAIVSAIVGIIWFLFKSGAGKLVGLTYVLTILGVGAVVFGWNIPTKYLGRFTNTEGSGIFNSRTAAWSEVLNHLSSNPLGVGWGATTTTMETLQVEGLGSGLNSIHNSYLQVIYELGWVGIIPTVGLVLVLIWVLGIKCSNYLMAGLNSTVLVGILIQFTESSVFGVGQPYPYLFWVAVLAVVALNSTVSNKPYVQRHDRPEVNLVKMV